MATVPSLRGLSLLTILAVAASVPPVLAQEITSAPVVAPDPTDYAGWMAKAREFLAHPGEGENDVRRKYDKSFRKPEQAAEAFLKAAALAPDDASRFEAFNEAGKGFRSGYKFEPAYNAFVKARDISVAGPLRAQAALDAATTFQQVNYGRKPEEKRPDLVIAEFGKVQTIPNAPVGIRAEAHRLLASYYGMDKRPIAEILEYENAARLDPAKAEANIDSAIGTLSKLEPLPESVAIVDRIYQLSIEQSKALDATKPDDAALRRRSTRRQWARQLIRLKAPARAATELTLVANDPKLPVIDQYDVLKELATAQREAKDNKGAVTSFDRALAIPNLVFFRAKELTYSKAEVQATSGDYPGAVKSVQTLASLPAAKQDDKADAQLQISKIHGYEAQVLTVKNKNANVTPQIEASRQALETGLTLPEISLQSKLNLLTERANVEAQQKNYEAAHQQVQRGLEIFKTSHPSFMAALYKTKARFYGAAKDYKQAMASLYLASTLNSSIADQESSNLAIGFYQQTLADKDWPAARDIVAELKKTGLYENDRLLMLAQVELEAGNKEAARPLLEAVTKTTLFGDRKKWYEDLNKKLAG